MLPPSSCPFGTDAEREILQRIENEALRPVAPLGETTPYALGGALGEGFSYDSRRNEFYSMAENSDALAMFLESQAAREQSKLATRECEAANTIFPLEPPPKTRQQKRRTAPPLTTDDFSAMRDSYAASSAVHRKMKQQSSESMVAAALRPMSKHGKALARPRGLDPLALSHNVDRFKSGRNRVLRIKTLDSDQGALKPGNDPAVCHQDTFDTHAKATQMANDVKFRNTNSTRCRQGIFGY